MTFFKTVFPVALLFAALSVFAQGSLQDTVIQLEPVDVNASRLENFAIGATIERIQPEAIKLNSTSSVSELFSTYSGVSVKSYGVGGVSTLSMRGGGSSHTAVIWNGLNIQSPMNGSVNLSSLPVFLAGDMAIQHGGSGTLYGSGAVSGVVHLSGAGPLYRENSLSAQASGGSFNNKSIAAGAKAGNGKIAASLKIFGQSAGNDFRFYNTAKIHSPSEKQTNAEQLQYGLMTEFQARTSANSVASLAGLYQHYDKNIQTQMTDSNPSDAKQVDDNLFISGNWQLVKPTYSVTLKSGYLHSRILYTDPGSSEPRTENLCSSFIQEAESKFAVRKNQFLNVGINLTSESCKSEAYTEKNTRNRLSFFPSYKIKALNNKLDAVLSARAEAEKDKLHPLVYSLGAGYKSPGVFSYKGNISKTYRIPTFNDLYWNSGIYAKGNPDLKPESGYSGEIGVSEKKNFGICRFEASQTGYFISIDKWIIWLPDAGGTWTPVNKDKGRSYGLELEAKVSAQHNGSEYSLNSSYTWTHARMSEEGSQDRKPTIYVPEHRLMFLLAYSRKNLTASYSHNFYSERFYDTSHTLKPYHLGDILLNYTLPGKASPFSVSFKLKNIWNTRYQVMAWYAMPLRHYLFSLNYTLK